MPVWLRIIALIPIWAGLDLMVGRLSGQPRGMFHLADLLWNILTALTGSTADAMLITAILVVISIVVVIVNLSLPAKTKA